MNEDSKAHLIVRMILVAEEPGFCRATKWPEVQGAVPGGAEGRGGVGDFRGVYTPQLPQPHTAPPHIGRPGGRGAMPLPPDAVSSPLLPQRAAFIAALGPSSEGSL